MPEPRICSSRPGLDAAQVAGLKAVLPLAGRYAECRLKENRTLAKSSDTAMFVIAEYQGLEREVFGCLFLDARNRLIRFQKMFWGSIDRGLRLSPGNRQGGLAVQTPPAWCSRTTTRLAKPTLPERTSSLPTIW